MDTLHTVLNRGCSIWDKTRMPEHELRRRIDQVRMGMKQRNVDLLLVYGDSWKFGHLAYVSHFIPKNRGALAVIPLEGEPALVIQEPSRNNPFSSTLTWIKETHSVGKFVQGLSEALKTRGLKPKRVGLATVEEQLNIREWRELEKLLENVEWVNMGDYLSSLRLVKSPVELSLLKEATAILEQALARFEQVAKPGQKEYQVMAELEREARRRGVEDFRLLLARSSTPKIGLRPATDSALQNGEAVLILIAASYQRYWSELGQTYCLGRPSEKSVKDYETANRVFHHLMETTKAGVSALSPGEVPAPVRDSLQSYGLGNGLGLDLTEEPSLGNATDSSIKAGMVLTLRACFISQDAGSALISRPYIVSDSGLEPLARSEGRLIAIGD
ncbi:MAG TPA: M24 family metallopeptidase [Candidatus Binatia bacterium]